MIGFKNYGSETSCMVNVLNPRVHDFDGYSLDEIHVHGVVSSLESMDRLIETLTVARECLKKGFKGNR